MNTLLLMSMTVTTCLYAAKPDAEGHDAKIQGTWRVETLADGGRMLPADSLKKLTVDINKTTIALKLGDKTLMELNYKLTEAVNWINLTDVKGAKSKVYRGIYELEDDVLKICYTKKPKERSNAFESKPDSVNEILFVLNRDQP